MFDDWIDENMYEVLLSTIQENFSDLVVCGLIFECLETKKLETIHFKQNLYDGEQIKNKIFPQMLVYNFYGTRLLAPNRVTKLFRKEILLSVLDLCDEQVSIGEDLLTTFAVMSKVKRISVLPDFFPYHYRRNETSMIHSFSREKYEEIEKLKNAMLKIEKSYNYDFSEQIHGDYIFLIFQQIEKEILFSNESFWRLEKKIRRRVKKQNFYESLKYISHKKLSFKLKVYLFLIKCNLFFVVILRLKRINKRENR